MALFDDISQFKQFVGGGANVSMEMDSIEPAIEHAGRLHIEPWLGPTLWTLLNSDDQLSLEQIALQSLVRRAVAPLALFEYAEIGSVQFSESGLHRVVSDGFQTAFRYQENNFKSKMREMGYEALESLLKFLSSNAAGYPNWVAEAKPLHDTGLVRYASEMRMHYSKTVSRYVFDCIRSLVQDVEAFAIETTLPAALVATLRTKYLDGNGSSFEKKAIFLAQRAIVHFALEEAVRNNTCELRGNAVVVNESTGDQAAHDRRTATDTALSLKRRSHEILANRHLSRLRDYILENPTQFPTAFCPEDGGTNTAADAWCPSTAAAASTTDMDACCAVQRKFSSPCCDDSPCSASPSPRLVVF